MTETSKLLQEIAARGRADVCAMFEEPYPIMLPLAEINYEVRDTPLYPLTYGRAELARLRPCVQLTDDDPYDPGDCLPASDLVDSLLGLDLIPFEPSQEILRATIAYYVIAWHDKAPAGERSLAFARRFRAEIRALHEHWRAEVDVYTAARRRDSSDMFATCALFPFPNAPHYGLVLSLYDADEADDDILVSSEEIDRWNRLYAEDEA